MSSSSSASPPLPPWHATLHRFHTPSHPRTHLARLCLTHKDPLSLQYRTLLIPVIDQSGSMASEFHQVRYSLSRVVDLTFQEQKSVVTHILSYSDNCQDLPVLPGTNDAPHYQSLVQQMQATSGTNFTAAFAGIIRVLQKYSTDPRVLHAEIVFMTDGQDTSCSVERRPRLVVDLKSQIVPVWGGGVASNKTFTLHTIGFTHNHDFAFLDALRRIGTHEGAYRFADPREDTDSLSNKINSLMEVIQEQLRSTRVPLRLMACPFTLAAPAEASNPHKYWVDLSSVEALQDEVETTWTLGIQVGG